VTATHNALCCEMGITCRSGSHECVHKGVLGLETRLDVVAVPSLKTIFKTVHTLRDIQHEV
jgi:hypothetical protein